VTVVVLVGIGAGVAAALHGAANSANSTASLRRPTGLTTSGQTFSSISLTWSRPGPGSRPTKYQVFEDGGLIASIAGTASSYRVTGLAPEQSYTFRLEAVDGKDRSPASARLSAVTSAPPPVSAAQLSGSFAARYIHPAFTGIKPFGLRPDEWVTAPTCHSESCPIQLNGQFQGYDFAGTVLHRDGSVYSGRTTLKHYFSCDKQPELTYLTIRVEVTAATVVGSAWQASAWTGSFTATVPPGNCTAVSIMAQIAGG
jgi:hypothetical protein